MDKTGKETEYDVAILGGGASGLASAITVKREAPSARVVLIEKNDIVGRKILSTGNGRCNLSNMAAKEKDLTLSFFDSVGVITRTDSEGRIYPYTEDAKDVRNALEDAAKDLGVTMMTGCEVKSVKFLDKEGEYEVVFSGEGGDKTIFAKDLLLSMGGKAAPKLGTTGDGYRIAKSLYHTVTKLAPALTQVETHEDMKMVSGVRAKARISLIYHGASIFEEEGEVQFTDYGISGICVFNMTRHMEIPEGRTLVNGFDDYAVEIDFMPEVRDAETIISERTKAFSGKHPKGTESAFEPGEEPEADGQRVLRSIVKEPVAKWITDKTKGDPEMTAWMLKHFMLHPKGLRGWDHAEITKGGVPLKEIDMETMASKFMPGLYFAGEIIDQDGPAGGYNLQNAWETGILAGRSIAAKIKGREE